MNRESIEFGDNCFDYLRVYSAIMIIIGHCISHLKLSVHPAFELLQESWIGLFCLFCLAGYLVPASLERSRSRLGYIKKRFLRLYPELYAALAVSLVCILVVGGVGAGIKYKLQEIIFWLIAQMTIFQFYTPASLEQYGVDNPNGALWTISMEIQIHFLIMFCWNWLRKQEDKVWFIMIIFGIIMNAGFGMIRPFLPLIVSKLINVTFIPYCYTFLIGMYCYVRRKELIPKLANLFWVILLTYFVWFLVNKYCIRLSLGHYTNIITGIYICILTMSGGYYFGKHRLKCEISYGLYIYHMIVINVFVMCKWTGEIYHMLLVLAITVIVSFYSNLLIQRPLLKWR